MEEERKFTLFGTDLQKIPCFKKTFTISTYSGIAAGLGVFLFTSRIKKSADAAVLTFAVTTLGYWFYCRHSWAKKYEIAEAMNKSLHHVMLNEGTKRETSDE